MSVERTQSKSPSSTKTQRAGGEFGTREIAGVLGYNSADELYSDLTEYSEKEGEFTAEEFIEEYNIDASGSVEGALSALGNFHGYTISTSLESAGNEMKKFFRTRE